MNRETFSLAVLILASALFLIISCQANTEKKSTTGYQEGGVSESNTTMCTQEAKQCPDGSYVTRTGPNCEFAPCPGEKKHKSTTDYQGGGQTEGTPKMCTQEAKQCPDGSYVTRTGPNCEFAPCPGEKNSDSGK
jgi:uncharacterized protein (UPF0179 family)